MVLKKVTRKLTSFVSKPFKWPKKSSYFTPTPTQLQPPSNIPSQPFEPPLPPPLIFPSQPFEQQQPPPPLIFPPQSFEPPPPLTFPTQPFERPPPPPLMAPHITKKPPLLLFPTTQSSVLPDPSVFFSPELISSPLPTNSFFQNFTLKNGDQPEFIHPYLIKISPSKLSLSYPSRTATSSYIYQTFNSDVTISTPKNDTSNAPNNHKITSYSDLSVTVDFPSTNLKFFLVRGSPYVTFAVSKGTSLVFTTIHAILSLNSDCENTKFVVKLNNNQTWVIYTSSPMNITHDRSSISTSELFTGIIRIAVIPDSDPKYEQILDKFSSCYPVSGDAVFDKPYCVEYKWEKRGGNGDLLMLAHPLHVKLLSGDNAVLDDCKYNSIDGELVGVVGDSWALRSDPVSVTWHSIKGIEEGSYAEIISALVKDVQGLNSSSISTSSSYFYGKLIARAARLALIAEEVNYPDAIPLVAKFLKETITPWLDGNFNGNGFLYDKKWGGMVTKQGANDSGADFGFGIFNDHHYHLGYFLYAIAVLAKIDPVWGRKYKPQAYSMMADFMNLSKRADTNYTRLRCFDLYKLHSWAGGLTEFADGRNQESTSEAVNAYYSAALMGLAYGDTHLVTIGSTLVALEMQAAQTWWHVRAGDGMYEDIFSNANKVMGVLWANKRDSALWFAPPEWKECRLGIQVLPILPITEALFPDANFVKDLVNWTLPALGRDGVGEGWKGFVYALEGIYDKESALEKTRNLKGFDDGNSLSNLLWWLHSRDSDEEWCYGSGSHCWYSHYCH